MISRVFVLYDLSGVLGRAFRQLPLAVVHPVEVITVRVYIICNYVATTHYCRFDLVYLLVKRTQ